MTMIEIRDLLGVPYGFEDGPPFPITGRLNCQSLVHEVYRRLGILLPENMLSKEIYEDDVLFRSVDYPREGLNVGDILIFGRPDADYKTLHLTVCTGERDRYGSPLLVHANGVDRQVSKWPFSKFFETPRYQKLYAVKRYRQLPNQETPV